MESRKGGNSTDYEAVRMDIAFLGMTAAVFVSILWTGNSILFSEAGRRIGALNVNAFRIVIAVLLLSITHIVFF